MLQIIIITFTVSKGALCWNILLDSKQQFYRQVFVVDIKFQDISLYKKDKVSVLYFDVKNRHNCEKIKRTPFKKEIEPFNVQSSHFYPFRNQ